MEKQLWMVKRGKGMKCKADANVPRMDTTSDRYVLLML